MSSNAPHQKGGTPPQYNYAYNHGGAVTGVQVSDVNVSYDQPSVVQVTQPAMVISEAPPDPKCGLILSALTAFFCCGIFGGIATLIAWKARLQVFDRKFLHARHTMTIMWIFFGLALFFGVLIWAMIIIRLQLLFVSINN
ncbi:uncharacterized protein [Littorina saxatilis]|uniref:Transmembrane protein n=1 Tax=Littorina saxatilis TaxID=31220 RepID=A0AAN9C5M8_9CAEN